jgi:hypothetical protein
MKKFDILTISVVNSANEHRILADGILETSGKSVRLSYDLKLTKDTHGKKATILQVDKNGNIVSLKLEDGSIFPPPRTKSEGMPQNSHEKQDTRNSVISKDNKKSTNQQPNKKYEPKIENRQEAHAPYNFIPLNTKILKAENPHTFDSFDFGNLNTGYIELEIKNLTPFFTRGEGESNFEVNGIPAIPGASLRGMIRSLSEIMSAAKFTTFNDDQLYFRAVAEQGGTSANLKQVYYDQFTDSKAGFLKYNEGKYFIEESIEGPVRDNEAVFTKFKYELSKCKNYWLIMTGIIPYKDKKGQSIKSKRPHKINVNTNGEKFEIENNIIELYENDDNREPGGAMKNILDLCHNDPIFKDCGVPVFFNVKANKVTSFGHTLKYRINYPKTISKFVVQDKITELDYPSAMFGFIKDDDQISGRLFFEDALCQTPLKDIKYKLAIPKILNSPKPTTFQHYIEQLHGKDTAIKDLTNWGSSEGKIRGYKMYWHRNTSKSTKQTWILREDTSKLNKVETPPIKAIESQVTFFSRIRFENLSDKELGLLLLVLDLPTGCKHKLGLGKPLGLGSLSISLNKICKFSSDRYNSLFNADDNAFNMSEFDLMPEVPNLKLAFITEYSGVFACDISVDGYWSDDRMKILKKMLDFENVSSEDWLKKTAYMVIDVDAKINEFKYRRVLERPEFYKK